MDEITDGIPTLHAPATDVAAWRAVMKELTGNLPLILQDHGARVAHAQRFRWEQSAQAVRVAYSRIVG